MKCTDIAELAPLYISCELDAERTAQFDAHLKSCPACMQELEHQARLDTRLREIIFSEGVDTSRVDRNVRALIATGADAPARTSAQPRVRQTSRRWVVAAMGIAAMLLLLAVGYRLFVGAHVGRVYADAATDHQREVVEQQPRKWVVDPAQIAALAERQGVPGATPAALAPASYQLKGARVCLLDGRPFLNLVYTNGAKEFSVYLRQRDDKSLPGAVSGTTNGMPLHTSNPGDEHIASFETAHLTAMVVTDESADAALHLASSLSAAL
jgi:anti-sigma factor RsiW